MSKCPICSKELYGGDNLVRIVPPYSSKGYGYHLLCLSKKVLGDEKAAQVVNELVEFVANNK